MAATVDKKLSADRLRRAVSAGSLGFRTTDEIEPENKLIGQTRAVSSISFGLAVDKKGYNIFVAGTPGSGRTTYSLEALKKQAGGMPAPDDWVYLANFDEPSEPLAVNLPAGRARELASETELLIDDMKTALAAAFDSGGYEDAKAALVKEFQNAASGMMDDLRDFAKERGFTLKRTPQGFVNLPVIRGAEDHAPEDTPDEPPAPVEREMSPDEYDALPAGERTVIQERSDEVAQRALETMRSMREGEKAMAAKIKELDDKVSREAILPAIEALKEKFPCGEKLIGWFDKLADEIADNWGMFTAAADGGDGGAIDFSRFSVNVFVSNDPEQGAPVIHETNPTYYNVMGKIEYESKEGFLRTSFDRIKAGSIQKANGGFLLLDAEGALRQFMSWDALKRVLTSGCASIENLGEHLGNVPVASLKPEPIPIDVKVVIIGTYYLYDLLNSYDPEFQKIFKIKADFDADMPRDGGTEAEVARAIARFVRDEGHIPFTAEAAARVIEHAARLAGEQDRLSTRFNRIFEVLTEATVWARMAQSPLVEREHADKAIDEHLYRVRMTEDQCLRAITEGVVRVDTSGSSVGQINGLTVISLADHTFGQPVRISANAFMGKDGVVSIEREVKMTGPLHNKGLLTLSSYLGRRYARNMPITVSICTAFEQTYSEIEGDSASAAELCCVLSALSGLPLRQDIAVTGSVDQFGNVQPIGGVNEKIEGFFRVCEARGLTGTQGVIIPEDNARHLMLSRDVTKAAEDGLFSVWAVSSADEVMEILTGLPAGEADADGEYRDGTVNGSVKAGLRAWHELSVKFDNGGGERDDKNTGGAGASRHGGAKGGAKKRKKRRRS